MKDTLIIEGKEFISSRRAAEMTKYSNDYVGQLCRQSKVIAKRLGRVWFIDKESILQYKKSQDNLLGIFDFSEVVAGAPILKSAEPEVLPSKISHESKLPVRNIDSENKSEFDIVWDFKHFQSVSQIKRLDTRREFETALINIRGRVNKAIASFGKSLPTMLVAILLSAGSVFSAYSYSYPNQVNNFIDNNRIRTNNIISQYSEVKKNFNVSEGQTANIINSSIKDIKDFSVSTYIGFKDFLVSIFGTKVNTTNNVLVNNQIHNPSTTSPITTIINLPSRSSSQTAGTVNQNFNYYDNASYSYLSQKIDFLRNDFNKSLWFEKEQNYRIVESVSKTSLTSNSSSQTQVTDLSQLSGTLDIAHGGTGATSLLSGFIYSDGTSALTASSSPTFGYLFATSTTASSIFMGNIGVGTTSPLAKLDVYGNMILSGVSRYLNFGDTSGSSGYGIRDNGGVIEFKNTGGSWLGIGSGGGGSSDANWSYFNGSGIRLATSSNTILVGANSTTTSSKLEVIGSGYFSGNLGIGTTSPWRTLSVKGNSDLGNNALAGSFTATSTTASVFPYASSTAVTVSGNLYLNSYNGPLQANNGVVSATTSIGVVYGGTGVSTFGQGWIYSSGGTTALAASTSPTVNYLVSTSTTATSTFAGPISIIGSSGLNVLTNGRVGIGTTSPYAQLSVAGVGAFDSLNVNSSATSTFVGGIQTNALNVTSSTASSTFANGISLSGGCYAINGTCIGSGTVDGSGSANKLAFWTGASTLSYNNNLSWLNSSSKFGIGTSTPNWELQIASSSGATIAITDTSATANTKHWTLSSLGGNFYLSTSSDSLSASSTYMWFDTNNYGTYLGKEAGRFSSIVPDYAQYNTYVGYASGHGPSSWISDNNTGVGALSLYSATTGYDNTAIGYRALYGNLDGDQNVAIGSNVGTNIVYGSKNIIIGSNIDMPTDNGLELNIGNLIFGNNIDGAQKIISSGNIGIGTTSPGARFSISGDSGGSVPLFAISSSTVGFATSTAFIIDSNGKVGIGTTTPYTQLSVAGNIAATGLTLSGITGSTQCLRVNASGIVSGTGADCSSGGASYDWLQQTNTFGVNSLTPTTTLPIWVQSTATSTFAGGIESWDKIGAPYFNATSSTATSTFNGGLRVGTSAGGFSVFQTGVVGIGTTSPQGLLDVSGSSNSTDLTSFVGSRSISIINTDTTNNNVSGFAFRTMDATGLITTGAKFDAVYTSHAAGAVSADLAFLTRNSGTVSEKMRILSGGNVGVGSTTPWARLSVNGSNGGTTPLFAVASSTSAYATSTVFMIDQNGQVGIGTANPTKTLDIYGISGSSATVSIDKPDSNNHLQFTRSGMPTYSISISSSQLVFTDRTNSGAVFGGLYGSVSSVDGSSIGNIAQLIAGSDGTGSSGPGSSGMFRAGNGGNGNDSNGGNYYIAAGLGRGAGTPGSIYFLTSSSRSSGSSLQSYSTSMAILKNGGNVGIGTTTPYAKLSVNGNNVSSTTVAIYGYSSQTAPLMLVASTTGTATSTAFLIDNNGKVGIATSTPWRTLSVNGTVAMPSITVAGASGSAVCLAAGGELQVNSGAQTCTVSSARFKNDIQSQTLGLDTIRALRPVSFKYNNDQTNSERLGLIAEEVNKVDPRLIFVGDDNQPRGVRYEDLTSVLTKAVQELDVKVEDNASTTLDFMKSSKLSVDSSLNKFTQYDNQFADITKQISDMNIKISDFASSTMTIASSTESTIINDQSFIQMIANKVREYIASAGEWVVSKISSVLAVFDRVETKTAAVSNGIEMTDSVTKEVWCIRIQNGDWNKVRGNCSEPVQSDVKPEIIPETTPVIIQTPTIIETGTTTENSTTTIINNNATSTSNTTNNGNASTSEVSKITTSTTTENNSVNTTNVTETTSESSGTSSASNTPTANNISTPANTTESGSNNNQSSVDKSSSTTTSTPAPTQDPSSTQGSTPSSNAAGQGVTSNTTSDGGGATQ